MRCSPVTGGRRRSRSASGGRLANDEAPADVVSRRIGPNSIDPSIQKTSWGVQGGCHLCTAIAAARSRGRKRRSPPGHTERCDCNLCALPENGPGGRGQPLTAIGNANRRGFPMCVGAHGTEPVVHPSEDSRCSTWSGVSSSVGMLMGWRRQLGAPVLDGRVDVADARLERIAFLESPLRRKCPCGEAHVHDACGMALRGREVHEATLGDEVHAYVRGEGIRCAYGTQVRLIGRCWRPRAVRMRT